MPPMNALLRIIVALFVTFCIVSASLAAAMHADPGASSSPTAHVLQADAEFRCPDCGIHRLRTCVTTCLVSADIADAILPDRPAAAGTGLARAADHMPAGRSLEPPLTPPIA